jgi:sugar porter (SP) family MFS transporter
MSDRWGRKPTLIFAGWTFAIGSIGSAMPYYLATWPQCIPWSAELVQFNFYRFVGGVGVGLASVVSPMYIAEVSPPRIRGALVTVNQLAIVVGLGVAVLVSYYLSFGEHWRWMLASNAAPVPIFLFGLMLVPESPRWMAQQNRDQEAFEVLIRIDGRTSAELEMTEIRSSVHEQGSWGELLRPGVRYALLIACSLAAFQQITGSSILTMYMPSVFQDAGYTNPSDAIFQNVIMSIWYVVCTVFALAIVDRLGRKPLLIMGTIGMTLGMIFLGILFQRQATGFIVVLAMFLAMGSYLISLAPLTWLIMSEIFPNRLRGKAMSTASVCVWTASFATTYAFPPLVDYFKRNFGSLAMMFWIFAGISAIACLFHC